MSTGQELDQAGVGDKEFTKEERDEASKILVRVISCNKCVKRIRRKMLAVKEKAIKVG